MKLTKIKPNESNPRTIAQDKLTQLITSLSDFPKMMALRPIVVDENYMILGGNMRYLACKELGYKDIPDEWVKVATDLTDEEKQRFVIEDNIQFGDWDYDVLANNFDIDVLQEWGLEVPLGENTHVTGLPEELEGLDLTPTDLEKLSGADNTMYRRVIIVFDDSEEAALLAMLGVTELAKVVYRFDEFVKP